MHSSDRILKSVTIYCWCCGSAKPTFPLGKCIQHIAVFKQLFHSYYFALLSCKVGNWTKCIARAFRKVFNYMLYSFMYFIYFIRTHTSHLCWHARTFTDSFISICHCKTPFKPCHNPNGNFVSTFSLLEPQRHNLHMTTAMSSEKYARPPHHKPFNHLTTTATNSATTVSTPDTHHCPLYILGNHGRYLPWQTLVFRTFRHVL